MSANDSPSGFKVSVVLLLAILLYALSSGPVLAYCRAKYGFGYHKLPEPVRVLYAPVLDIPTQFGQDLLEKYLELWMP